MDYTVYYANLGDKQGVINVNLETKEGTGVLHTYDRTGKYIGTTTPGPLIIQRLQEIDVISVIYTGLGYEIGYVINNKWGSISCRDDFEVLGLRRELKNNHILGKILVREVTIDEIKVKQMIFTLTKGKLPVTYLKELVG